MKNEKLKILEVHSLLIYAGGQRNILTFEKYFRKDLFDIHVMGYLAGGNLEPTLKRRDIPYIVGDGNIAVIQENLQKERYDVIHIHRSGKYVRLENELITFAKQINPEVVIIEKNVFGGYDPSADQLIDCHFFQSMMHLNERYLPAAKKPFDFGIMKVLYNMVDKEDFEQYRASKQEIQVFRSSLDISERDYVVGKVGRKAIAKWSDLVIDMAPHLQKLVPNAKIVLVGCPDSRKKRIEKSKYAHMFRCLEPFDTQEKLHLFYQSIDVLTHSSKIGECNGNTINEAFFWKKPVITNSTPRKDNGQLEQVIHEKTGLIANNPITFAKAIHHLYRDKKLAAALGENGFNQISTVNNPKHITQQVEKFLIETMLKKDMWASLPVREYQHVSYDPTEKEIVAYTQEYQKRLEWGEYPLTFFEQCKNIFLFPKKLYWKVRDIIEDRFLS